MCEGELCSFLVAFAVISIYHDWGLPRVAYCMGKEVSGNTAGLGGLHPHPQGDCLGGCCTESVLWPDLAPPILAQLPQRSEGQKILENSVCCLPQTGDGDGWQDWLCLPAPGAVGA